MAASAGKPGYIFNSWCECKTAFLVTLLLISPHGRTPSDSFPLQEEAPMFPAPSRYNEGKGGTYNVQLWSEQPQASLHVSSTALPASCCHHASLCLLSSPLETSAAISAPQTPLVSPTPHSYVAPAMPTFSALPTAAAKP